MQCNRLVDLGARGHIACANEADYRVGLELRNHPKHAPAEAWLGIVVCEEHKGLTWDDVVNAESWKQICDSFNARGLAVPSKKHSRVVVQRIEDKQP